MMRTPGMVFRNATAWLAFLAILISFQPAAHGGSASGNQQPAGTLTDLIEAFFLSDDAAERAVLASLIDEKSNGSVEAVAQAVQSVGLWSDMQEGRGVFLFESASAGAIPIAYDLPAKYSPASRYPMLLCMPNEGGSQAGPLARVRALLDESIGGFVLIAPATPVGGEFHQPLAATGDLRRLMRQVLRRFHIETDRVYIFGVGTGGDAAWMAATMHPDLFAGAIMVSSYPHIPYAGQGYRFLLDNLRRLPVLTIWGSIDPSRDRKGPGASARQLAVDAHNQAIAVLAKRTALPITSLGMSGDTSPGLRPPRDQARAILREHRAPLGNTLSRWFRYPAQGRTGWLRQARFAGDVWEQEQLSIIASARTDHDAFITEVIKSKMAYLGGRIDGQTIDFEASRCARVELLLPFGLVDFDKPITIRCNGKQRFAGLLRPDIQALLENAYQTWDFNRLIVARFSFSIRPTAP